MKVAKLIAGVLGLVTLAVAFQNCGQSFQGVNVADSGEISAASVDGTSLEESANAAAGPKSRSFRLNLLGDGVGQFKDRDQGDKRYYIIFTTPGSSSQSKIVRLETSDLTKAQSCYQVLSSASAGKEIVIQFTGKIDGYSGPVPGLPDIRLNDITTCQVR